MRFHTEHHIRGRPEQVVRFLSDPAFYEGLDLPDLSRPEVLAHDASSAGTTIRLRYEFLGNLDPVARRLLGNQRLTWVQEVHVESADGSGTLSFGAERDPKRLHGDARFTLEASGGDTIRLLDGELVVAIPGVGGMAERRIVPGVVRRMDIEAEALDREIAGLR